MPRFVLLARTSARFALLISCACWGGGCAASAARQGPPVEVAASFVGNPHGSPGPSAWLLYGMERRFWIDVTFDQRFPGAPAYRYTYEEEVDARDALSAVWTEMKAKEHVADPYLDDVSRVWSAGFLREYVWYCVPHPGWGTPSGLRSAAFASWFAEQMPNHRVETWVKTAPSREGMRVIVGEAAHPPVACALPAASAESAQLVPQAVPALTLQRRRQIKRPSCEA